MMLVMNVIWMFVYVDVLMMCNEDGGDGFRG